MGSLVAVLVLAESAETKKDDEGIVFHGTEEGGGEVKQVQRIVVKRSTILVFVLLGLMRF